MVGNLVWIWMDWGVLPGLVIVGFTLFWIFYDSHQREQSATVWRVISILAMVLVLPSVVFRLVPSMALDSPGLILPFAWLGILASLGSLFTLMLYVAGVGTSRTRRCAACGVVLDPSWEFCPYCQQTEQVGTERVSEVIDEARPALDEAAPEATSVGPQRTTVLKQEPTLLAWLIMRSGPWVGRDWPLREVTNIGRDSGRTAGNHIVIDEQIVSRQHARIKLEDGEFVLYDLASSGGTFVNGERVLKRSLEERDVIRVGGSELVFIRVAPKAEEEYPPSDAETTSLGS